MSLGMTLAALQFLIALLCALCPDDGLALHEYDKINLPSDDVATEHLWTARVASVMTDTDADELLAFAQHESNFISNVVSKETAGVSCGVMTPEVLARCTPKSLLEQYLAGGTHLRGWYDAMHGSHYWALVGVAGGYVLIAACKQGPVYNQRGFDVCTFPSNIDYRVTSIRRVRVKHQKTNT